MFKKDYYETLETENPFQKLITSIGVFTFYSARYLTNPAKYYATLLNEAIKKNDIISFINIVATHYQVYFVFIDGYGEYHGCI